MLTKTDKVRYVREILTSTDESVEQVTIDPFGKWSVPGAKSEEKTQQSYASYIDDDDLIISSFRGSSAFSNATPNRTLGTSASVSTTPNTGTSHNGSAAPRSTAKRPAPEVIDLTLSDDEDDPYPPAKRVNIGQNGFHNSSY